MTTCSAGCPVLLSFLIAASAAVAQTSADYAVQVSATVATNPAWVALSWAADAQATSYTVYRRSPGVVSWGSLTNLGGSASGCVDSNVTLGGVYEYRIDKSASAGGTAFTGVGYAYVGIQAPLVDSRGKIVLLVDAVLASSLGPELARLQQDLVGDGWQVLRHDVSISQSVQAIKSLVKADYDADPANVKALFLFGHIPVPYSGNFAPDGHAEHVGAWPADVYYGDMNGTWTDSSVNSTGAVDPRNRNVAGDGKFDQSTLPSDAELQIGRVDLSNLPVFARSEEDLMRQYLNKDHKFRFKQIQAQERAVVSDSFGSFNGEAFAGNGWRNFAPFFGAQNIAPIGGWTGSLRSSSYLWGYGCGPGGWSSAMGVTTSSELATNDPQVVFTMLFGSYLGDWDSTDNLMRAGLATPTYTLTCCWAGRPWWQLHHMALGETIGYGTRLSQNNSSTYSGGQRTRGVHVALMGDPTLRMHPVSPPGQPVITTNKSGGITLSWAPSTDDVQAYLVYSGSSLAGPFTRVTANAIATTSYTDAIPRPVYMVRAVRLQTAGSGSYFNASQGVFQTLGNAVSLERPALKLCLTAPGALTLTGNGTPGQLYDVQASSSSSDTNWTTLGSVTADSSGAFNFTDSCARPQRVYRTVSRNP